jgi:hypothetical protein
MRGSINERSPSGMRIMSLRFYPSLEPFLNMTRKVNIWTVSDQSGI